MLEHVPGWLGKLLQDWRAGHAKLISAKLDLPDNIVQIDLMSPAFAGGTQMPVRFTADGEGHSPPLVWGQIPPATQSLVLVAEDPDAPMPEPIFHALIFGIHPTVENIPEGDMRSDRAPGSVAHNSFGGDGWLPPDPPTGHGIHDYVFQLFALDTVPALGIKVGRSDLLHALDGHVIGIGVLIGQYWRGEAAQFEAVVPTIGLAPTPSAA